MATVETLFPMNYRYTTLGPRQQKTRLVAGSCLVWVPPHGGSPISLLVQDSFCLIGLAPRGVARPACLSVLCCAGLTPGLVWNGRRLAVSAQPEILGLLSSLFLSPVARLFAFGPLISHAFVFPSFFGSYSDTWRTGFLVCLGSRLRLWLLGFREPSSFPGLQQGRG